MRVGLGFDFHPFKKGKKLVLGGIIIKSDYGLSGHSDADVIIHSIVDAILGALGKGDIGSWFPDTDIKYKNIDSSVFLNKAINLIKEDGYKIANIDVSYIGEKPKISKYRKQIRENLEKLTGSPVNIKATTMEKLGPIGREEGAATMSIVLLEEKNNG